MIEDFQRKLAQDALIVLGPLGFVLAGSGAIREHGIIARPTEDVDLFARSDLSPDTFSESVDALVSHLENEGYSVTPHRNATHFFSAEVDRGGTTLQFDMGIDYREFPPATLSIGPVLDVRDAVANKLGAMCSRGEPRDYLDADAIRLSKLFEDAELLALTFEHDPASRKTCLPAALKRLF